MLASLPPVPVGRTLDICRECADTLRDGTLPFAGDNHIQHIQENDGRANSENPQHNLAESGVDHGQH